MALNLKVQHGEAQKMFRFNQEMTIFEVCKQIKEKLAIEGTASDHGLFQPAEGARMGRWLRPERTLMYYDIKSNDLVTFKKKHRPMKIRFMDDTIKTVMVDDSLTVSEIVENIGQRLNLTNHEEYSLARPDNSGWLHPTQSLTEQGIEEKDVLVLKKKFFVTDQNVDRGDPVQLHLVFIQCKDSITSGSTPCQYQEAVALAALLMQVELGNFNPQREVKNSLREKMPKLMSPTHMKHVQYDKIEKDIFGEWKKLTGMSEINAKFRFVQLCRSLKTYGITCFEVQQKGKGKKLETMLIGVTKDAIFRMDPETKEIFKTNKLTELKRWAASPKSFTLDFGDYESDYYTVVTNEGEAMSQLISGYIDIILKRRKDMGRIEKEDDSIMAVEEFVAPVRANAIETMTSSIGQGAADMQQAQEGVITPGMGMGGMSGVGPGQLGGRGVGNDKSGVAGMARPITDIDSAENALNSLAQELDSGVPWARMPSELTPEQWRAKMQDAMMAASKNINELMSQAAKGDKSALNALSRGIFQNIAELVQAARMAGVDSDDDVSLLESAKLVSEAVAGILKTAKDLSEHPGEPGIEARLAQAAKILQAAQLHLNQAMKGQLLTDPESEELILASAKALSDASRELRNQTMDAAKSLPDPARREQLTKAADTEDQTAQYTYLTARTLAGVMLAPGAKQTVEEASKATASRLAELQRFQKAFISDPSLLEKMGKAAKDVNDAIQQLLLANEVAQTRDAEEIPDHVAKIHRGLDLLEKSEGQKPELIKGANDVARSGVALVGHARQTAQLLDPAAQERLLSSAKVLSEHTAAAGVAAKGAVASPQDHEAYRKLIDAVRRVKDAADNLQDDAGKAVAFKSLRKAAKEAAASTTELVATARGAALRAGMKDEPTRHRLNEEAANAHAALQRLLDAVRNAQAKPDNVGEQQKLLITAQQVTMPASSLVTAAKTAIPKVEDIPTKMQLNKDSTEAQKAVQQMIAAIRRVAEATGAKEIEQAQQDADVAIMGSEALLLSAEVGMLEPTSANLDPALQRLNAAANALNNAAADLRETAATKPDRIGFATRGVGTAVRDVADAAKEVAHSTGDKTVQMGVLAGSKAVGVRTKEQIDAARGKMLNPNDAYATKELEDATQLLRDALASLLAASQGADISSKECDDAVAVIQNEMDNINPTAPNPGIDWGKASEDIDSKAKSLSAALAQVVVASKTNTKNLPNAAKASQAAFVGFVQALNATIGSSPNLAAKTQLYNAGNSIGRDAIKLLSAVRFGKQDPARLDRAYNDATSSITTLLTAVDNATPGNAEIAEALKMLQDALQGGAADGASRDAGQNRKLLNESGKSLADTVGTMSVNARNAPERLGGQAKDAARHVTVVMGAAANLSPEYLDLQTPADQIQERSAQLVSTRTAIAASKDIARAANGIVNQTRVFVQQNPNALDDSTKRELIQAAQGTAAACSGLAGAAKDWVRGQGTEDAVRNAQRQLDRQLQNVRAVNQRVQTRLASSTRSNPALVNASRQLADATVGLVGTLRAVSARPKDQSAQSQLAANVSNVGENIKRVLDQAATLTPGQRECDEATQVIQAAIGDLAACSMQAAVGCFTHPPPAARGKSVQECQESVVDVSKDLATNTTKLVEATFKNQAAVGPVVESVGALVARLAGATKDVAAASTDPQTQQQRLNLSKNLADDSLALVKAVKAYMANPSTQAQQSMIEKAKSMRDDIANIVAQLKGNVLGLRQCDEAYAAILEHEKQLDQPPPSASGRKYEEVRSQLQQQCVDLVGNISRMLQEAQVGNADSVGPKSREAADNIGQLMPVSRLAAAATTEPAAKAKLLQSARDVCRSTAAVVQNAKSLCEDPKNAGQQDRLNQSFNQVTEAIRNITAAMRYAARGERDCEAAIEAIQKTNGDLETAALFAAGGIQIEAHLEPGKTLEDYSQTLLQSQNALLQDSTRMQAASQASLEDVGSTALSVSKNLANLAQLSKNVVALLNNDTASKGLLNCAKQVGTCALQLVFIGRELQTQPQADSAERLSATCAQLRQTLTELQHITADAAGPILRALQAIEHSKTQIGVTLQKIDTNPGNTSAKTEDVGVAARHVVAADQALVRALGANNYDEIMMAAQSQGESTVELLNNVKGAAAHTPDQRVRAEVMEATKQAAQSSLRFLEAAKQYRSDETDSQQAVTKCFDEMNERLQGVIGAARKLPEGEDLDLNEDSLAKLAEQELLNAAKQIEAAANRIMNARPRDEVPANELRQQDIAEGILEAARAITKATAALMNAATASQKEIMLKGRANKLANPYKKDPAWAQGLISAAREVAATTDQLVTSANDVVQRKVGEEHIIASAREVAGSTARLVAASKAKADPMSTSGPKLEAAARTVASATAKLVEAAKLAMQEQQEEKDRAASVEGQRSAALARKAQLEAQVEIARLESALEAARKKLGDIRNAEYAGSKAPSPFVNLNVGAASHVQTPSTMSPKTQVPKK